jgi:hypothetical protein
MFGRHARLNFSFFKQQRTFAVLVILALASSAFPQEQAESAQATRSQQAQVQNLPVQQTQITIPAGTHVALVLTHPIDSKTVQKGDQIYAQTTAPVIGNDHVAIPVGTFVQGTVEKLSRHGSRGEINLQSVAFVFSNGYIASLTGGAKAESEEGTAYRNPNSGAKIGAFAAPAAGLALGAAIGSAAHTTESSTLGGTTLTANSPKGLAIGSMAGVAAGSIVSIVLLASAHHFFVDTGSAMELVLPRPISVDEAQVAAATKLPQPQLQPIVIQRTVPAPFPTPSTDTGTCYAPGSPGTPDTVIPGTPPVGNSPGTPPIVIPGTPATPPIPHPCP